jgi:hypothetical protein
MPAVSDDDVWKDFLVWLSFGDEVLRGTGQRQMRAAGGSPAAINTPIGQLRGTSARPLLAVHAFNPDPKICESKSSDLPNSGECESSTNALGGHCPGLQTFAVKSLASRAFTLLPVSRPRFHLMSVQVLATWRRFSVHTSKRCN